MKIKVIHIEPEFVDKRGEIARVINQDKFPIRAALRIVSKAGTVRSNHYHKNDYHYLYVESGKCEYFEKPADKPNAKIEKVILKQGDLVLSSPGIIHAVKYLEDTIMYAYTSEKRGQEAYEKDTKRVKLIE